MWLQALRISGGSLQYSPLERDRFRLPQRQKKFDKMITTFKKDKVQIQRCMNNLGYA